MGNDFKYKNTVEWPLNNAGNISTANQVAVLYYEWHIILRVDQKISLCCIYFDFLILSSNKSS